MMPWDWIGMVTIRSDTRRSRSISGTIKVRPGSRTPMTRPSRNSTPRSYCLTTRTDSANPSSASTTSRATNVTNVLIFLVPSHRYRDWVPRARGDQPVSSGSPPPKPSSYGRRRSPGARRSPGTRRSPEGRPPPAEPRWRRRPHACRRGLPAHATVVAAVSSLTSSCVRRTGGGAGGPGWLLPPSTSSLSVGGGRGARNGVPLATLAYLDALGLGLLHLGHHDLQHAVVGRGLDAVGHHVGGQGDRAAEGAVAALDAVELLLGGVMGEVPLALDGQQAVLEGDLEVVERDAGEFDGHQVGVLALGDVQRRRPGRRAACSDPLQLAALAERPGKHPGHLLHLGHLVLVLRAAQVLERVPARNARHRFSPCVLAAMAACRPWRPLIGRTTARRLGENASSQREQDSLAE